jgi:RNA polymerase sigma factor (sigma-70 family)
MTPGGVEQPPGDPSALILRQPPAPPTTVAPTVITPVVPSPPTTGTAGGYTPTPTSPVGGGPGKAGLATSSDTPAFRVSAVVPAGGVLHVNYTLAAHDATDTASVTGVVTLTHRGGPVTIPASPLLAGRRPDVLTLRVQQQPGVFTARPSATLFLTPATRVGDSVLFEAHRLGRSPEAFRLLVQRHGAAVTRACERIVGNGADAQDLSQSVFLELSKFQTRFSGTLAAWLQTVSRHAALAFLRAKRRRRRHEQQAARPVAVEAPPPVADEWLASALGQLPPDQAEAVRLRYLEGYTQQEAAGLVGCPRGTLSRRAADGIQALRAILSDISPSNGEHPHHERH